MVQSFCCFRLQTAGIIIGWIGAVLSLIHVASYSAIIAKIDDFDIFNGTDTNVTPSDEKKTRSTLVAVLSIYLAINVVNCAASILLVAGTLKERHLMLVPWLINSGIAISYNMLSFIALIAIFAIKSVEAGVIVAVVITGIITVGIQLYAWLAIHGLFKMIRASREEQRLLPSNNKGAGYIPNYTRI